MNFNIIGFDLDGTLYPTTPEIKSKSRIQIYNDISHWLNIPLKDSEKLFESFYLQNGSGSKTIELIADKFSREMDGRDFINNSLSNVDILSLLKKDYKTIELLNYLSNNFKFLDLITAREENYALSILEHLGISFNIFDALIFQGKNTKKQDGSIYKKWIDLRKIEPNFHLYIGDNEKADIDIPKSLGIKTCMIGNYNNADFNIENILGLYELLNHKS